MTLFELDLDGVVYKVLMVVSPKPKEFAGKKFRIILEEVKL